MTKTILVRDYPDPRSFEEFLISANGHVERQESSTSSWQFLYDLFLPVGYPETVPDTYLSYQLYDSLQGLCSYLRGVWCAAAVLEAVGVGDASASAVAVAIQWVTKDGLGIIGGLVYSYCASHLFDGHVKEFRLLADVMNDIGLFLDMLAPYFRDHLLYLSGMSVLCKTICGISAGATKGTITQHFAIAGNMADLNAKEATQETLMSLIGMIVGVWAAKVVHRSSWTIFIVLTLVHVWANWKGVMLLRMRTLNRARADIVFADWIRRSVTNNALEPNVKKQRNEMEESTDISKLPMPDEVYESLWASFQNILFPRRLELGVPLSQLLRTYPTAMDELNANNSYVLIFDEAKDQIKVSFLKDQTSDQTILRAYLHARLIQEGVTTKSADEILDLHFGSIIQILLVTGWDLDRVYLDCSKCRSTWTIAEVPNNKTKKE